MQGRLRAYSPAAGIAMLTIVWPGWAQSPRAVHSSSGEPKTFYRDVRPILQRHCQSCHRAQGIAPLPFETFSQTRPYAGAIRASTQARTMPPWFAEAGIGHFSNDTSLSAEEIATIAAWADDGAPAGAAKDAPRHTHWAEGWSIDQPDLVLQMMRSVALPAHGEVDYTYEIVPTRFTKGRWIRAVEILPSARANVHHAVVYVRPPDSDWLKHAPVGVPFTAESLTDPEDRRGAQWTDSDVLLVYAPGSSPDSWPATMAKWIPAGSDLVFQMHYTANGRPARDRSSVGVIFSKESPAQRVLTLQLTNDHFVIPPGAPDYRVEARGTLPGDALLLSFMPHMHLRGKRFEYNIVRRRGTASNSGGGATERVSVELEPLLRVNYDFHWQMSYQLSEPLFLKAGTELQAVAWFDNSRGNPHNPDPSAEVRWGEQTYDEMMVGFFDVAVAADMDKQKFFQRRLSVTQ